ncbi:hypothetical protein CC53_gp094 [Rhizobium phage vB_RleS_L338C]|uniref:hypothetical protein n=1 Tax=Rhizobium phage vB_RleS_L338C TaxID=1414737 RepID=UPI0003D82A3A|nr:hypothetical protein CC53_gp094 [Rhizobium phage vB_RleS_L338C]AHC30511.1 hypothetical protein L338C_094 [Rhizobium phage vB_RleS_L338C]QNH72062.1 hypothetical protein P11VFA_057 [Rhizobium phage P11VFA]
MPEKQETKRKVWLGEDRPSVIAQREAKERAERLAKEAAERRARIEAEEAQRKAMALVEAERALAERRAQLEASRQQGYAPANTSVSAEASVLRIDELLTVKANRVLPVHYRETIEGYYDALRGDNVYQTTGVLSPPPANYSYYLLTKDTVGLPVSADRPARFSASIIMPEVNKGGQVNIQSRSMYVHHAFVMPIELTLALRGKLPKEMADRLGAVVVMEDEGRGDLRQYRVDHEILNDVLSGGGLYDWGKSINRDFKMFGARAAFGSAETAFRGASTSIVYR